MLKKTKKMVLGRETIRSLTASTLSGVAGGAYSYNNCSKPVPPSGQPQTCVTPGCTISGMICN